MIFCLYESWMFQNACLALAPSWLLQLWVAYHAMAGTSFASVNLIGVVPSMLYEGMLLGGQ